MPKTAKAKVTNSDESAPAAKKTKTTPKKEKVEKRAKLYRTTCPIALQERLERAATQRLYLIQQSEIPPIYNPEEKDEKSVVNFTVLGSTGNVYTVVLGLVPSCTCPDYSRRQDMCKHIMFILLKVIGLDVSNPLAYQKAYISSELNELYTILRTRRVGGTILANDQVRAAVAAATSLNGTSSTTTDISTSTLQPSSVQRRSLLDDSDCPICFDDLTNEPESKITFCRGTCGANFHEACIRRWLNAMTLAKPTCPHCRQEWVEENGRSTKTKGNNPKVIPAETTYTNLGSLQGLSNVRDSSTYSSYKDKKRRY